MASPFGEGITNLGHNVTAVAGGFINPSETVVYTRRSADKADGTQKEIIISRSPEELFNGAVAAAVRQALRAGETIDDDTARAEALQLLYDAAKDDRRRWFEEQHVVDAIHLNDLSEDEY